MRIGLDIADTMTRHWPFFAFLAGALLDAGHEVVVLTFRMDRAGAEADLVDHGVRYSKLVTATEPELDRAGWERWKGVVCLELGIELLIDDDPEVQNHLPAGVLGLMPVLPERGLVYYD